ncbi:hypothetical protein HOY82DRAFT_485467 [Tuber indicum]|nr:hypothetical protein HOY82DRAFT_485467 [Tuber indicum]
MRPFFLPTPRLLTLHPLPRPSPRPPKSQPLHTILHPSPSRSPEPATSNSSLKGHNHDTPSPAPGLLGLDIYSELPSPVNSVEALYDTHFLLASGIRTAPKSGIFLLNDFVFSWAPDVACKGGLVGFGEGSWGVLEVVWPKPELLIIGTGKRTLFLAPEDKKRIAELGVRVDVMDTGSAVAQFNLLATERGSGIAGALLARGFKG